MQECFGHFVNFNEAVVLFLDVLTNFRVFFENFRFLVSLKNVQKTRKSGLCNCAARLFPVLYMILLNVLQCRKVFLTGTNLNNFRNIIYENLSVSDISGTQLLFQKAF